MIKPDIIVSWPRNCDYPLWRQFIHDNRTRFNLVIIVFTETNQGEDYREFVKNAVQPDYVLCADSPTPAGQDWRQVAVNHALLQSYNAQWVWFTEQDFYPGEGFWEMVQTYESTGVKAIGVKQGDRLHPCCLMIRRDLLDSIKKDFAANPPEYDHFGAIQKQLEERKEMIGIIPEDKWQHLNGLSHNMTLLYTGGVPNYQPEVFAKWLKDCLEVSVPQDPRFTALAKKFV